MAEQSAIRNREYMRQIKDFSGLRFGKIMPTDIDCFIDFGDRLFIFVEGKHTGAQLPTGQRLAIERISDACNCPPRRVAVAIIIDHNEGSSTDVNYAETTVRSYRWNGKWMKPSIDGLTLKQAIDRLKAMSENMLRQRFQVVK